MSNNLTYTALCALCVLVLLGACERQEMTDQAPLRTVRTITVTEANAERIRKFTGVSESDHKAKLSFKIPGTVTRLDVAVGDTLSEGQVIAEIDASTYALQLQQTEADLARAKAEQRNAEADYQRIRGLYENNSTSKDNLDQARAGAESAKAQVRTAAKAVELAHLNLSYTRLPAKAGCLIATISTEVGENIASGQEIVQVNCGKNLNVILSVPENAIADFVTGIEASVTFDSDPMGNIYRGIVSEVGVAATGTAFPVTVTLEAISGLRTGLSAEVSFVFDKPTSAVPVVPSSAVGEDEQGRHVFVVMPDESGQRGQITRRAVETGRMTREGIEVTTGINPGDQVVTAGVSVMREGLVVKIDR